MRAAYYVRVSTMQQVQTQTIEQQLERLAQAVQERGWAWQSENIFRDDGYSGSTLKRPGLDQLRDQVASACFDIVLVTAPDRLARKYIHQMLLVEEFEKSGCELAFLDRPMSDDPNDQLLLQIRGAVAEYERTLIAERMRRGRQYKYRSGQLLPWTQAPYGYRSDPDQPRAPEGVQLVAEKAAIVAEIYARFLEPASSLSSVAKWLTQSGIPSPTGLDWWRPQTVRLILKNPVYTGKVYAGRKRACPVGPRRSPLAPIGQRSNSTKPRPAEEWVLVGFVPAIVTQAQFDQVQAKFEHNKQFAKRNNKALNYLLRALVSCGLCQHTCRGQTRNKYAYYQCAGKDHFINRGGGEPCPSRLIPMKQLDEVVWHDVCQLLTHPDSIATALQRAQSGDWLPQELKARRQNLHRAGHNLANQLERLTDAYLAEVLGLEEYRRRRQDLEQRLEALNQQERLLENQVNKQVEISGWVTFIEDFCQRVQVGLEQATFDEKRRLIELLIDRVVVTNEEVEIRYVIPTAPRAEHTRFYQLRQPYCGKVPSQL